MKKAGTAVAQAAVLLILCVFLLFQHCTQSYLEETIEQVQTVWSSTEEHFKSSIPLAAPKEAFSSLYSSSTRAQTSFETASPSPVAIVDEVLTTSSETPRITATAPPIVDEVQYDGPVIDSGNSHIAVPTGNPELLANASVYVHAIMSTDADDFDRLSCASLKSTRYDYLRSSSKGSRSTPKYFFALDLYQSAHLLPRLLGTVVEAMRFLGPDNCALSVVEGRSTDGTFEILQFLKPEIENIGAQYHFTTSDVNPLSEGTDRIKALADLRNQALAPLVDNPKYFGDDTTVVFLNDVALCMEDILELLHQRVYQNADMVCAMDWIDGGSSFYDVWASRGINGDQFFEIPQNGGWEYHDNLFWNDNVSRDRVEGGKPFQVFGCWNGATAFTAKPVMEQEVVFRSNREGECYLGEPVHFAKDLWKKGHGKIAVVPSVNVGYSDRESTSTKEEHGYVWEWVETENASSNIIEWQAQPPEHIKCVPTYRNPSWVRWDE